MPKVAVGNPSKFGHDPRQRLYHSDVFMRIFVKKILILHLCDAVAVSAEYHRQIRVFV